MLTDYSTYNWYHVSLRWDGSTGSCFLNGVLQTSSNSYNYLQPSQVDMQNPAFIGIFSDFVSHEGKFNGQIKYGRFYNAALTDAEIQALKVEAIG